MMHQQRNRNIQPARAARFARLSSLKQRALALALSVAATAGWLLLAGTWTASPLDADGQRQLSRHWFKKTHNPNHLKTWRRNKWKWFLKKKKQGRAYRYYKDRPGWTPNPNREINKRRRRRRKRHDDDAVALEKHCSDKYNELENFVNARGSLQCFDVDEAGAGHDWNEDCDANCRHVNEAVHRCVCIEEDQCVDDEEDMHTAVQIEYDYLKDCEDCDCHDRGFEDDDGYDDDGGVTEGPCDAQWEALVDFVDEKGDGECFDELEEDHEWGEDGDNCAEDCRVINRKMDLCVLADHRPVALQMEYDYFRTCNNCDCLEADIS